MRAQFQKKNKLIYPRGSRPGILHRSPEVHKPLINNCPNFHLIL